MSVEPKYREQKHKVVKCQTLRCTHGGRVTQVKDGRGSYGVHTIDTGKHIRNNRERGYLQFYARHTGTCTPPVLHCPLLKG